MVAYCETLWLAAGLSLPISIKQYCTIKYSGVTQLLLLCVCILFHRMKKFNKMPQEIDLNVQYIFYVYYNNLKAR